MKYIADGAIITNRILFSDGRVVSDIMGGSGMYAYSALRLCTPDSMLIAGVGKDFDQFYGKWFTDNQCVRDGLVVTVEKTNYNELKYNSDGSYIEYSIYGDEYEKENYPKTVCDISALRPFVHDAKGVYTCAVLNDRNTRALMEMKGGNPFKVMWEIPESTVDDVAVLYREKGLNGLLDRLRAVDIFSLNRNESYRIFGVHTPEDAISELLKLDRPVYYRVGRSGAYIVDGGVYHVPMLRSVEPELEIDPTGCGNSSTAAAMWAYCEGYDPLTVCVIGNMMASFNVQQYGLYPNMSRDAFHHMMELVDTYKSNLKNGRV